MMDISIHALLAESDNANLRGHRRNDNFYPRSPCGERPVQIIIVVVHALFLSTLSLRRATRNSPALLGNSQFLSTLSLRRATPAKSESLTTYFISIHALLAESDTIVHNIILMPGEFLSTLSLRRATNGRPDTRRLDVISIHALLAESDVMDALILADSVLFLSTLSLRRATALQ